ncbi:HDOD domain-containing protein [Cycloclasticus pugetii]|uniref:HDOD domain-containing protein n=1 Tax=Cycloclasticus pugetii TaxID=34068 RepID=UPI0009103E28|nr:HDOD domain-containing protein [Cycloclasticus pugetii]SHI46615.1 HD-like signal output (HDOD) domain, no enzymatic activity [Cycloclasticus pugetii]
MSSRSLTNEEVNSLFPIRNFSDNSKQQLQGMVKTEQYDANSILFSVGKSDDKQIYLLEGKVQLTFANNKERIIEGGKIEARFPINNSLPHQATATAVEEVTVLSIERSTLDNLLNEALPNSNMAILEESEDPLLYNQLYFEITQEMQANKLTLPSIPETAIKVRKAISNPHATSDTIAQLTQQDPAITAQLIKVANSPLFRGREKIESLPLAITRLGIKATSNLVTTFTMRMVFNAKTKDVKDLISALWLHSRDVSGICAVMAKKLKGFNTDKAMLAGLIHDIGSIPILTHADKHPNLIHNKTDVQYTLKKLSPVLGKMVLKKWNFTDDFIELTSNAENWERKNDQPANYTDLIIVAQLLSFRNTLHQDSYPEASSTPAYNRLSKLLRDPNDSLDVLENSQEELALVKQLFN